MTDKQRPNYRAINLFRDHMQAQGKPVPGDKRTADTVPPPSGDLKIDLRKRAHRLRVIARQLHREAAELDLAAEGIQL